MVQIENGRRKSIESNHGDMNDVSKTPVSSK